MTKTMLRCKHPWGVEFTVGPEEAICDVKNMVEEMTENKVEVSLFAPGKVPLDMLPEEVQREAKETLKAFDEVSVVYENRRFHVTTVVCLCAHYAKDHFVCGRYFAREVFTTQERRLNSLEVFGYIIPGLKGRDG